MESDGHGPGQLQTTVEDEPSEATIFISKSQTVQHSKDQVKEWDPSP